jgi:hypothetical protein
MVSKYLGCMVSDYVNAGFAKEEPESKKERK